MSVAHIANYISSWNIHNLDISSASHSFISKDNVEFVIVIFIGVLNNS
jgi:hypothetical protein